MLPTHSINAQRPCVVVELLLAVLLQRASPAGLILENHLWFATVHLKLINQPNHLSSIYLACAEKTSFE